MILKIVYIFYNILYFYIKFYNFKNKEVALIKHVKKKKKKKREKNHVLQ